MSASDGGDVSSVTPDHFRFLCSHFATGVTIVTTFNSAGEPCGMTASSFASVSLDPPLISIAVDHTATIYPAMRAGTQFAVNILADHQEGLSRRFAESLPERFDGVAWHRGPQGELIIGEALSYISCDKWAEIVAGDHTIFLGRVTGGEAAPAREPLLHYRGTYPG